VTDVAKEENDAEGDKIWRKSTEKGVKPPSWLGLYISERGL
jgi:hypothetical protein